MPTTLIAAGVTTQQFTAGLAAGISVSAFPTCFSGNYTTVPNNLNLRTSAGQGRYSAANNYDPSMPSTIRCDSVHDSDCRNGRYTQCGGPFGVGQSGTAWYRLPAGHSLPTAPVRPLHCGTDATGWLSGWAGPGQPDRHYATPAGSSLPPPVGNPPAAGTVCFHSGGADLPTCDSHIPVRAVSCGAFALWELQPVPICTRGYCLAA
jgi:hypothetical protein